MVATIGFLGNWLAGRRSARSDRRWHKWTPCVPVRLADGAMSVPGRGQVWRRASGNGWEYSQDEDFDGADDEIRNIDWD